MSKISVEYDSMPGLPEGYDRGKLLDNAKAVLSAKESGEERWWPKIKCCCPKKVKFFLFNSNVIVINKNATCPPIWLD